MIESIDDPGGEMDGKRVGWSELGTRARLFRVAHAIWGAFNLAGLGYLAWSAATRRRDNIGLASAAILGAEGVALVVGRGDCPCGPFQASLGDPVPMFEWVLPPRAAKAAIPFLTLVAVAVLGAFGARSLRTPRVS
jgi:hypothetical protein